MNFKENPDTDFKDIKKISKNEAKEEIKDFLQFVQRNIKEGKITYVLEPKFDGFSVEAVYKNGVFNMAIPSHSGH